MGRVVGTSGVRNVAAAVTRMVDPINVNIIPLPNRNVSSYGIQMCSMTALFFFVNHDHFAEDFKK